MKYTNTSIKTQKENPANETARNAQLLMKAGFIHKTMAGAYTFLPMGLKVLNKIANVVREEMNAVGSEEILMSALAPKDNWEQTGRWDTVDVLYKMETHGSEVALSPTHEEIVTPLIQEFMNSYKDFPKCVYQIQTKFRNEPRAKSGLLRGREFLMKDAYSFHLSQECFEKYYEKMTEAYHKVYERLGLGDITKFVYASGGDFSKFSHEFQTLSEIGEDELYYDSQEKKYWNKEIVDDLENPKYEVMKAVEVGNIFPLASKFSEPFKFSVSDENGKNVSVIMGCYGIGISRIMGVIAEIFADDKGLVWPKNIAPYDVHLIALGKDSGVYEKSREIYETLKSKGIDVFYDDRQDKKVGPGQKFGDAELIGIPVHVVISERLLENGKAEIVDRKTGEKKEVGVEEIAENIKIK